MESEKALDERISEIRQKIEDALVEAGLSEDFANNMAAHLRNAIKLCVLAYGEIKEEDDFDDDRAFIDIAVAIFSREFNDATIAPALGIEPKPAARQSPVYC